MDKELEDCALEMLCIEVTEHHFAKERAVANWLDFLEDIEPTTLAKILEKFEAAGTPRYVADIAQEIRWFLDPDALPKQRRNVIRLVTKDGQTTKKE